MLRKWNYLKYVLIHKWYVFLACIKLRVSLWTAITHDWSKLSKQEFLPYAMNFFNEDGTRRQVRDKTGAYDPNLQPVSFKYAWLSHQKNKHHWQAWVSIGDYGNLSPLPMPYKYVIEMIADWRGAGMAISGKDESVEWYQKNKEKMILHPDTVAIIEENINVRR